VQVTIPWEALHTRTGVVDLETGTLSAETARRLACDASISPIIVDQDGTPVAAGEAPAAASPTPYAEP
jgi:hypothetical protein